MFDGFDSIGIPHSQHNIFRNRSAATIGSSMIVGCYGLIRRFGRFFLILFLLWWPQLWYYVAKDVAFVNKPPVMQFVRWKKIFWETNGRFSTRPLCSNVWAIIVKKAPRAGGRISLSSPLLFSGGWKLSLYTLKLVLYTYDDGVVRKIYPKPNPKPISNLKK